MGSERFIIIMNGYTACLKTTTARRIADTLQVPLIEAYRLGRMANADGLADNSKRDSRYLIINQLVELYLKNSLPVVIDGSFNFHKWRDAVYAIGNKYRVSNIIVVKCTCENVAVAQARLQKRATDPTHPDQESRLIENYFKSKAENEAVEEDTLPDGSKPTIIEFDTVNFSTRLVQGRSTLLNAVMSIIEGIKDQRH